MRIPRLAWLGLTALSLVAQPAANPILKPWTTPFGVPPFSEIKEDHFLPAFREAIAKQKAEVQAILAEPQKPTFGNTVEALEYTGQDLERVSSIFFALSGAETNPRIQAINRELSPLLAAHRDDIHLNAALWQRVKRVWSNRERLKLNPEQARLLEKTAKSFLRAGADLTPEQQVKMRALNAELSQLSVAYGDRLLKATKDYRLVVEKPEDLAGLSEGQRSAAAQAAKKAGLEGKWLFNLDGPSIWPFLQFSENRELRRQIHTAYLERCQSGETDTKPMASRIAALRVEKAQLLGYANWADYILEENMAKSAKGVYGLLEQVWGPSLEKAKAERAEMQALMTKELPGQKLEPWDWRFYEEKVRKAKFDLDENALKPYFSLDQVRSGAFHVATQLYGLSFSEVKGLPTYHEEVRVFEVKRKDGRHLGLLYTDYHPRPGKRGGAWCGSLRGARNRRAVTPVMTNVCSFSRPAGDAPALLTPDEVKTLFHEFGHALHGLFYAGKYRSLAGSPRDFVELPSQVMENWAMEPEVLKVYAKHWKTGAVIPAELAARIKKARTFGQGFATTEYMAATLLDMDWHSLKDSKAQDADAFEKASLAKWGVISEIPPRYRTPYFNHIWASGYSAGYYSYIWSAVLDSDAFKAFEEKGNLYDPTTAAAFQKLMEQGQSIDPAALYRSFRGRDPKVEALLEKRGLVKTAKP